MRVYKTANQCIKYSNKKIAKMNSKDPFMTIHSIALIGAGRIGRVHAASIVGNPRSRLKYVADASPDYAAAFASDFNCVATTPEAALGDEDIAAIVIASSTDTHVDFIEQGMAAGKHVFCEKPIDLDIARVDACLAAIAGSAGRLFIAFNRRFDTHFGDLRRRVAAGEIGELELLTITSKDPGPPPRAYLEVSGGLIRDMMIHDIDLARFILNEEPTRVMATGAALFDDNARALGDLDTAVVTLQTPSGKIATISNSRRASFGYDQRIEAHGSKGMLSAGNLHQTTVSLADESGIRGATVMPFFLERYDAAYRAEWDAFIDYMEDKPVPAPTGIDGQRALMIANAGYESLKTGRAIDLTW